MSEPSEFERNLGRVLRSAFGSETKVFRYGDDQGVVECRIVSGRNCPVTGATSYGSIGLSRMFQKAGTSDVSVEIVAACATNTPCISNLVASCVFEHFKNGTNIAYGACLPRIIDHYGISKTLQHVTFVAPFLWPDLDKIEVLGCTVYPLLMLPISDAEFDFLVIEGIDSLEALFETNQIDVFNINRPSVVG